MILSGYVLSLDILRGSSSLWITIGFYQMGLLTMFLVVVGTVLFIASFLPYIVQRSKKRKRENFIQAQKLLLHQILFIVFVQMPKHLLCLLYYQPPH